MFYTKNPKQKKKIKTDIFCQFNASVRHKLSILLQNGSIITTNL